MAMLFITHNLGVVAQIADRVAVMYAGQIVEQAPVEGDFRRTGASLHARFVRRDPAHGARRQDLAAIPGRVPPLDAMPAGCRFAPRCPLARGRLRTAADAGAGCGGHRGAGHLARCHVRAGVISYAVRRLLAAIPTLLAVLTLVFVIVRIVPGDPAYRDPRRPGDAGRRCAALDARLGLDRPLWQQYVELHGPLADPAISAPAW